MDDLNKAFNHLFGFKVPIDDYDEFEKKVEEARELKEHLDKVEILKDIPQIITPVKMTNYDRIKSMSVEEMAEWFVEVKVDLQRVVFEHIQEKIKDYVIQVDYDRMDEWKEQTKNSFEQWLLQEVSENE